MKHLSKLRYRIPLYAAIFLITSLLFAFFTAIGISNERQIAANKNKISSRLNYLQGVCEYFYQNRDIENIQKTISTFSAEEDMIDLIVTDQNDTIIASNIFLNREQKWQNTKIGIRKELILKTITNKSAHIGLTENDNHLEGYTGLCRKGGTGLKNSECGFIYYRMNLSYHFSKAKYDLFLLTAFSEAGTLFSFFILVFAVDRLVARKINVITETIHKFTGGDRKQKLKVTGDDELADLERSINSLFSDVATGEFINRENTERLNAIITTIIDGIIVINSAGLIETLNPAAENIFGYTASELRGKNVKLLMPEPYHSKHDEYLKNYLTTGNKKIIGIGREVVGMRKNGSIFPLDLAVTEMHLSGEKYFTGIIRDITERKELMKKLETANNELQEANQLLHMASITDGLTGLYNRRYFDARLNEEFNRCRRSGKDISLILCDIDHFKLYNDTYGHQMGDECLKRVSEVISSNFKRGGEISARYGGEEFVIILPGINHEEAFLAADALRKAVFEAKIVHDSAKTEKFVTLSLGVASLSGNSEKSENPNKETLISMADEMLYKAKNLGRNRAVLYPV